MRAAIEIVLVLFLWLALQANAVSLMDASATSLSDFFSHQGEAEDDADDPFGKPPPAKKAFTRQAQIAQKTHQAAQNVNNDDEEEEDDKESGTQEEGKQPQLVVKGIMSPHNETILVNLEALAGPIEDYLKKLISRNPQTTRSTSTTTPLPTPNNPQHINNNPSPNPNNPQHINNPYQPQQPTTRNL